MQVGCCARGVVGKKARVVCVPIPSVGDDIQCWAGRDVTVALTLKMKKKTKGFSPCKLVVVQEEVVG